MVHVQMFPPQEWHSIITVFQGVPYMFYYDTEMQGYFPAQPIGWYNGIPKGVDVKEEAVKWADESEMPYLNIEKVAELSAPYITKGGE